MTDIIMEILVMGIVFGFVLACFLWGGGKVFMGGTMKQITDDHIKFLNDLVELFGMILIITILIIINYITWK